MCITDRQEQHVSQLLPVRYSLCVYFHFFPPLQLRICSVNTRVWPTDTDPRWRVQASLSLVLFLLTRGTCWTGHVTHLSKRTGRAQTGSRGPTFRFVPVFREFHWWEKWSCHQMGSAGRHRNAINWTQGSPNSPEIFFVKFTPWLKRLFFFAD